MEKKACTFFGHRDCPETIKPKIRMAVIDLIENHGVTMFYVEIRAILTVWCVLF